LPSVTRWICFFRTSQLRTPCRAFSQTPSAKLVPPWTTISRY